MPPRRRSRGHIEQLPSGSFRVRVYGGIDPLTKRRRNVLETAPTYELAKRALTRLQGQVDEDKHPKSNITVRQAIESWLEVAALEATTRERYDDLIRLYILPTFGQLQAAKLDAELLERFYARLHRCRAMCSGKPRAGHTCRPLSTSTTRKVHYIIRGALDRAVRWRHLGVNKAAMAIAPSPERTEPDPPNADEAARLLNAAWADPEWGLLLWLRMLTGPRRGEISALRWHHVDFDRGLLTIHRSNAQPKTGLREKSTKTGQARKIALDQHMVGLLITHRARPATSPTRDGRCASAGWGALECRADVHDDYAMIDESREERRLVGVDLGIATVVQEHPLAEGRIFGDRRAQQLRVAVELGADVAGEVLPVGVVDLDVAGKPRTCTGWTWWRSWPTACTSASTSARSPSGSTSTYLSSTRSRWSRAQRRTPPWSPS